VPKASVIIPTYNHDRFVSQAVDSALAQTYPDVEVVVVDDGSTDQTRTQLAKYEGQIDYIYQENKGLSAARNAGILAARGDYFLFLDADDLVSSDKLELHVPLLEARPDFGLVYSGWKYIDEDNTQVLGEVRPGKQGQVLKDLLCRTLFFPPGAAVVRRECLDQVGLFDESCPAAADTDMWVSIARAGYAFGYVDRALCQYRVVKGSMSSNNANQARNEFARLDKFFADPDLPDDIKALEAEVYSILHYEFGAKCYHAGEVDLGQEHLRKAISTCPSLASDREWLLEWIAGYALGPHIEEPCRLIDLIFDNLPPEATTLRSLRRQAYGRYHTAAAFSAYQAYQFKKIRPHILPALRGDPSVIRNRGFLRIAVQSLFG
jgi:glycosyltransferase involved in cell wall biosynthesis